MESLTVTRHLTTRGSRVLSLSPMRLEGIMVRRAGTNLLVFVQVWTLPHPSIQRTRGLLGYKDMECPA